MTREEAIAYGKECLSWNEFSKGMKMYQFIEMAIQALSQEPIVEKDPCETCGYAEGSPFCLQYCPYDVERTKEQEPCTDAVSREEEIKKLKEQPTKVYIDKTDYQQGYIDGVNQMVKELKAERQKPETVTEFADRCRECGKRYTKRQTGKWKRISMDKYSEHAHYWYECDRCGKHNLGNTDYCPNCGADMREEQTD